MRNLLNYFGTEIPANHVSAHWQRETCFLMPPLPKIEYFVQAHRFVEELTFVNQQPGIAVAVLDCCDNLIERHNFILDVRHD